MIRLIKLHGWDECLICKNNVHESHPHIIDRSGLYCWNCAFVKGKITEKLFLSYHPIRLSNIHAVVKDGVVITWTGKPTPPWERTDKEQRHSPEYIAWRSEVFKRDDYTCQDCKQRRRSLNAHHIKSFKKFKKLRHVVSNGITLCEKCHRLRHKGGD